MVAPLICLGFRNGCSIEHSRACLEWNQEDAGRDEGEITERSLRSDDSVNPL